jgi:hypothetical protein
MPSLLFIHLLVCLKRPRSDSNSLFYPILPPASPASTSTLSHVPCLDAKAMRSDAMQGPGALRACLGFGLFICHVRKTFQGLGWVGYFQVPISFVSNIQRNLVSFNFIKSEILGSFVYTIVVCMFSRPSSFVLNLRAANLRTGSQ